MKEYYQNPEINLLKESVRKFIEKEILPFVDEWEKNKECPRHIFERMGEEGFIGVSYPTEVGGGGMGMWGAVAVAEEFGYANCGGLGMSLYAHTYLPLPLINVLGTQEQKDNYLTPALHGKKVGALAITEPGAGSDVGGIKTFAEDKGDHLILNGSKTFITNGTMADFIVVVARTGSEDYNFSLILFDTKTPGFKADSIHNKLGMHTSDTAQLYFEDCIVPKSAILGQQGAGFYYLMNNIQEERLLASVTATFLAEWALEKGKAYAKEREAFGRPISKFQVIRHKLAEMAIKVEACKSIAFRAVTEFIEDGAGAIKIITIAKAFTCEQSQLVVNDALQIHGGWGFIEDFGIARAFRDSRLLTLGAGTTEIMNEIISKIIIDEVSHKTHIKSQR